jgi:hypothetical protein
MPATAGLACSRPYPGWIALTTGVGPGSFSLACQLALIRS